MSSADQLLRLLPLAPEVTPTSDLEEHFGWSPTRHYYPVDLEFRVSGMSPPQVGDRALCGYIKRNPPIGKYAARKFPLCAECHRRAQEIAA